jgi:anti-sigma28 factor (negative regulator of flagellin synthesis)
MSLHGSSWIDGCRTSSIESTFGCMSTENSSDHVPPAERRARAEWQSLLARLQAADGGDVRLLRVRHAIASGEFQVDARAIAERLIARLLVS